MNINVDLIMKKKVSNKYIFEDFNFKKKLFLGGGCENKKYQNTPINLIMPI